MNKLLSFLAGSLCGVLVGGVATLLFTPASGEDLRQQAEDRWQMALDEAKNAREERRRELENEFALQTRT